MDDKEFWLNPDFWDDPDFWDVEIVDFHETPAGAPYVWMLGRIVLDFNYTEHQLNTLLWAYATDDLADGHSLTSQLGSRSVSDLIGTFARKVESDPVVIELTEFAIKAFEICRINRNMLAHTMTLEDQPGDQKVWIRPSRKSDTQYAHVEISGSEMNRVSLEIANLARFIPPLQLRRHLLNQGGDVDFDLPQVFEMPKKLKSTEVDIKAHLRSLGFNEEDVGSKE